MSSIIRCSRRSSTAFVAALSLWVSPILTIALRADEGTVAPIDDAALKANTLNTAQSADAAGQAAAASTASVRAEAEREFGQKNAGAKSAAARAAKAKYGREKAERANRKSKSGVASTIQNPARPFDLKIVDVVREGGSDEKSGGFQKDALPGLSKLASEKPGESGRMDEASRLLDPSKLKLKTDSDVRVYFVRGEGDSANSLGFTTDGSGKVGSRKAALIFPNATGSTSSRSDREPLLPGDFVNLGSFKAGSLLDFFLIANGANGGRDVLSTQRSANPDGVSHVVSYAYAMKDSPYLIVGFEDQLGHGDRDFKDMVFALDIGKINLAALTNAPEPAGAASLAAFLGLGWFLTRGWKRS